MTSSVLIPFAVKVADVTSGAALTLVMPLALLVVAFIAWFVEFRRSSRR